MEDVWRAQDAALEASTNGSDAEYQQLATACRQTEAAWRPELAPPVSDGLARALGDYCRAENAKAEAAADEPVPYSLTPAAEAELESSSARGPYPGSGDPERLAEWCGFPSAAAMEAACAEYERDMTEASEADARWEAEMAAEAATAEDPEAEL
jgi:hypothetical protein